MCKDGYITVWDCSTDESGLIPKCENPYKVREGKGKKGEEEEEEEDDIPITQDEIEEDDMKAEKAVQKEKGKRGVLRGLML